MPLLELQSIRKDFPGVRALDGVSFALEPGEVHALCGENGAGKSTLIKVLCGYYPAGTYGGTMRLRETEVRWRGLRDAEARGIALIAQELALVPDLSVAENVLLGRLPTERGLVRWDRVHAEAQQALERVGLDIDPRTPVRRLGIGQQQLVEIAKALAKNAVILVLDEPTAALPEADANRLLRLLGELRAAGVSSLYVSHRLEEVFAIADRITVLRDGQSVGTERCTATTPAGIIRQMVGRDVRDLYPRPDVQPGPPLLAIENWNVRDGAAEVIHNAAFTVHAGEIVGIAGLMGAGRTALLASLFGAARGPVSGQLTVADRATDTPFRSPTEAIAAGVALVSEDRKQFGLVLEASVLENLTLATLRNFVRHGFLDDALRRRGAAEQVAALQTRTTSLDQRTAELSGGNQQKVVLGKWLLARPRLLLLDEPTRGIDVGAKAELYRWIAAQAAAGLGVVLVSSDLPELLGLSHRVVVLNQGHQTAVFAARDAHPEAVLAAATRVVRL